jgi:hypothetical protein
MTDEEIRAEQYRRQLDRRHAYQKNIDYKLQGSAPAYKELLLKTQAVSRSNYDGREKELRHDYTRDKENDQHN